MRQPQWRHEGDGVMSDRLDRSDGSDKVDRSDGGDVQKQIRTTRLGSPELLIIITKVSDK